VSRDAESAELPDSVQPPVERLIERGRAMRTRRAALSVACAAVVIAAGATLPSVLGGEARGPVAQHRSASNLYGQNLNGQYEGGPSAAELARFRWSALPRAPRGSKEWPLLAWTGKDLIVLSLAPQYRPDSPGYAAAFNMATSTWRRIAPVPSAIDKTYSLEKPAAVSSPILNLSLAAAWTGRVLFVTNYQIGPGLRPGNTVPAGLYDPATNRWALTAMPPAMSGVTSVLTAVWTGRDIVVAGTTLAGRIDIAACDPATRRWTMISPSALAHPANDVTLVATSSRLIVFSHWYRYQRRHHHRVFVTGIDLTALNETGHWTTITGAGWPQDYFVNGSFFTGSAILVPPSERDCLTCLQILPGFLANPTTLRRTTIPIGPLGPGTPTYHWTGRAVLAVSLNGDLKTGPTAHEDVQMALYDPVTGRWRMLPAPPGHPWLAGAPLWTGTQLLELTGGNGTLLSFHR
jgi:hypothetical protein